MKILVVVGQNLLSNNSANLCHMSYIRGFVENGHDVTVLTASAAYGDVRADFELPNGPRYVFYKSARFYHDIFRRFRGGCVPQAGGGEAPAVKKSFKAAVVGALRKLFSLRGVYATTKVWAQNASRYKSDAVFDAVVSLSWPAVSHKLAGGLISKKRVVCKKYIQVWEDPWACDLYGGHGNPKIFEEENRLLEAADKIVYVTPLTLENQQKHFPRHAAKMGWQPLPSYYTKTYPPTGNEKVRFGYFGQYEPSVRNLRPFYEAAIERGTPVFICGEPHELFDPAENIEIYPRMPLGELEKFENKTDCLVCVANLGGGQIPGKIYQYAATNKAVLFILDGDQREKETIKRYFSQFNRFCFCNNNKKEIIEAVDYISANFDSVEKTPSTAFSEANIAKLILESDS